MRDKAASNQLRISAINYSSTNEYKSRMIDHNWEEFSISDHFDHSAIVVSHHARMGPITHNTCTKTVASCVGVAKKSGMFVVNTCFPSRTILIKPLSH